MNKSNLPEYYYKNDNISRIKYWFFEEIIPFIIIVLFLMIGSGVLSKLIFNGF